MEEIRSKARRIILDRIMRGMREKRAHSRKYVGEFRRDRRRVDLNEKKKEGERKRTTKNGINVDIIYCYTFYTHRHLPRVN